MLRILSLLMVLAGPLVQADPVVAQTYPSRQLTIVVPYPPGTNADTIARLVAEKLSQSLKQPVIIENKPGGATVPGTVQVVQAPADGYTLLHAGTNTNINPLFGIKTPYSAERDLVPVVQIVSFPPVLVVHPSVAANSASELVALAKSKPGEMNYGSAGIGNIFHLAMEQFKQRTGTNFTHVPFRGLGPALVGIIRNDVQVMVADFPLVLESIRAGKLRALAQTGSVRAPHLPDVPTFAEAGVSDYEAAGFLGIWARTGTPAEALDILNREVNKALVSSEFKTYAANGMIIAGGSAADFAKFLENDRRIWGRVIAEAGINIQ